MNEARYQHYAVILAKADEHWTRNGFIGYLKRWIGPTILL